MRAKPIKRKEPTTQSAPTLTTIARLLRHRELSGPGEARLHAVVADLHSLASQQHYRASQIDAAAEMLHERLVLAVDSAGVDAARVAAAERLEALSTNN